MAVRVRPEGLKECSLCKRTQPHSEFAWRNKTKGTVSPNCKSCQNLKSRAHYKTNRNSYYKKNEKRREELAAWIRNYKESRSCLECGKSYPAKAMHFHHRVPEEKSFEISRAPRLFYAIKRIEAEIAKCDLLCALCHSLID